MKLRFSDNGMTAACLMAAAVFGCGEDEHIQPAAAGSYSSEIQPIFSRHCTESCHETDARGGGLDLASWERVFEGGDSGEVVVAFRADESSLLDRIEARSFPRMPPAGDTLREVEIAAIRSWIDAGAHNDAGDVPFAQLRSKIYVASMGSDQISVLSAEQLVAARLLTIGSYPHLEVPLDLVADPLRGSLYVTLYSSGELWKYDLDNDSLLATTFVGRRPGRLAVSPDGSMAYVAIQKTGTAGFVAVVDAVTMTAVDTIDVGWEPTGIVLSPDGARLYTSNAGSDDISIVDLTLDPPREISRIPVAADADTLMPSRYYPSDVVPSTDGHRLFVPLFGVGTNHLCVIDVQGDSVVARVATGGRNLSATLSRDGSEVWTADWNKNTLTIVDTSTLTTRTISHESFAYPNEIAFSPDGRLAYVVCERWNVGCPDLRCPPEPSFLSIVETASLATIKVIKLEEYARAIALVE